MSGGSGGFSAVERAAMKERAAELKNEAKRAKQADKEAADKAEMLAKIAAMPDGDRQMAERLCDIVAEVAPHLVPRLFYGQPGWANEGKLVCFFRSGRMDKLRYSTFGFQETANLDEPTGLWVTSFALTELTEKGEATIRDYLARVVEGTTS